ncbi:MAG: ParA family protein [Nitrospirae bacterium]|nr:ParA family protein [Nitrospirota bacterium]
MAIISIANHKGGTGKTSMCLGIGVYFARNGYKVLIIDMDPQGHIAPGLGIDIGYDDPSMADVISLKKGISDIIIKTNIDGLYIAPATIRLNYVSETLYNTFQRERRLKKALADLIQDHLYDVILIDCSPSMGPLVENALTVSDYCLIPCEPSSRSIDGLADFMHRVNEIREGVLDNKWFIVLSRVKKAAKLTNEVIDEKLSEFTNRIIETKVFERETVNQAQIAGVTVFDFPRAGDVIDNYTKLGAEISKKCGIKKHSSKKKKDK